MKIMIISIFVMFLTLSGIVWGWDCGEYIECGGSSPDSFVKTPSGTSVCYEWFVYMGTPYCAKKYSDKSNKKLIDILERTREFISEDGYNSSVYLLGAPNYPFLTQDQLEQTTKDRMQMNEKTLRKMDREMELREEIDSILKELKGE